MSYFESLEGRSLFSAAIQAPTPGHSPADESNAFSLHVEREAGTAATSGGSAAAARATVSTQKSLRFLVSAKKTNGLYPIRTVVYSIDGEVKTHTVVIPATDYGITVKVPRSAFNVRVTVSAPGFQTDVRTKRAYGEVFLGISPVKAQPPATGRVAAAGAILDVDRSLTVGDEARMQKDVFYPAWYLKRNPDVAAAYGAGNVEGAIRHWIDHGVRESRMPNPFFHAASYVDRWPDLRAAFGTDYVAATNHWVTAGIREGRDGMPGLAGGVTARDMTMRSSASLLTLDADTNDPINGGRVQVWSAHGAANQKWDLVAQGDGTYVIYNRANGRVLDADFYGLGANGTRVQMWEYNGGRQQRWTLQLTADGTYIIRNAVSNRALDVEATQQGVNGGRMQLWDYIGGSNQKWRIA
ncbi:MAG: 1,4-beta-xylanase [Phycisphaerales bacterium]|nr:1,4-beta-xylanase [Phycisphaerales bacterium]